MSPKTVSTFVKYIDDKQQGKQIIGDQGTY